MRKSRDIKLEAIEKRDYLVAEQSSYTSFFLFFFFFFFFFFFCFDSQNLLAIEIIKAQILMNKSVYLGLSILELSKMVM